MSGPGDERGDPPKKPGFRLMIATPVYGTTETASIALGYHTALMRLMKDPAVQLLDGFSFCNVDLVRARSRMLRMFLGSSATHCLFWDADVVPGDLMIIRHMLLSGKDLIGAPYPRKRVHWDKCANADDPEAEAYTYPYQSSGVIKVENGCASIDHLGFGFTLVSRHCAEVMTEHYGPMLTFRDGIDGQFTPTVALFNLMIRDGLLLSEDFSFCQRWKDIGGEVSLYVGPCSPVNHLGSHLFRGVREGVVRTA